MYYSIRNALNSNFTLDVFFSSEDEVNSRLNARRSLVPTKDIQKGRINKKSDLTFKRPAHGLSPKYIDDVVGKQAKVDVKEDDIIKREMI